MIDTGRFFMVVSAVACVATFASAFAESGEPANPDVAVLSTPASVRAALPAPVVPSLLPTVSPEVVESVAPVEPNEPSSGEEQPLVTESGTPRQPVPVLPPQREHEPEEPKRSGEETAVDLDELASLLHEATNRARKAAGLPPLKYDATLAANATAYSRRMQRENFLGHTDPQDCALTCRFQKSGYEALAWGENLARWRSSYEPEATELATYFMREWLRSDGHRDNILSPDFTVQGIGYAIEGGEVFVTVHFAEPL